MHLVADLSNLASEIIASNEALFCNYRRYLDIDWAQRYGANLDQYAI